MIQSGYFSGVGRVVSFLDAASAVIYNDNSGSYCFKSFGCSWNLELNDKKDFRWRFDLWNFIGYRRDFGGIEKKIWLLKHEGADLKKLFVPKKGTALWFVKTALWICFCICQQKSRHYKNLCFYSVYFYFTNAHRIYLNGAFVYSPKSWAFSLWYSRGK